MNSPETTPVSTRLSGPIAMLSIDNPPVNALGHAVRAALLAALQAVQHDPAIAGIVITCAGRSFAAGADISEFGKPPRAPTLRDLVAAIDTSEKPTVAAIHGSALGGGLELALCCRYRVVRSDARLGLPEVKLGLIPGSGGTVRLPYLVGPQKALEMIASGEPVGAAEALAIGLADFIAEGELTEAACRFLTQVLAQGDPRPGIGADRKKLMETDLTAFETQAERLISRARGLDAPLAAVEAVRNSMDKPFAEALAAERVLFDALVAGSQSKALRHLFFAERSAARVEAIRDVAPRPVTRVGIVGAGTMGGGIAMAFANAGLPVIVVDIDAAAIERGRRTITANYAASLARGSLDAAAVAARLARLEFATDLAALAPCDLIVEAAFEDLKVKLELFAALDRVARPGAVLATNTSYLDVDAIAGATSRPDAVVGLHFFSPANVMRLLEIVRGEKTGPDVLATALDIAKRIGKMPVVVGVCRGFVGNRMLGARNAENIELLLEGATPAEVDRAFTAFGWPMGPFQMQDLAGLDISWRNRQALGQSLAVADELCALGRFGQKSGRGFYLYAEGSRTPQEDPEVLAMVARAARERGLTPRSITAEEIIERSHYPLVNEGTRILDEGIAARASDIDVVWTAGYGFPRSKGGPMFWAETLGFGTIVERLDYWHGRSGKAALAPSDRLRRLARGEP